MIKRTRYEIDLSAHINNIEAEIYKWENRIKEHQLRINNLKKHLEMLGENL